MSNIQVLLDRLQDVRERGNGDYIALCPAHDDSKHSLSIRTGDNGKPLLKCFASCTNDSILAALRLKWADIYPENDNASDRSIAGIGSSPRIERTYPYTDEVGTELYEAVRYTPKDFKQRRKDGSGGYVWSLKGVRRVLYRLPEIVGAPEGAMVFLVEGEKDCHALIERGLVATTVAGGANSPWLDDYSNSLRGKRVVVIPDNDDAGRKCAAHRLKKLRDTGIESTIVALPELPEKGDAFDWLAAGGTAEELIRLAEAALQQPDTGQTAIVVEDGDEKEQKKRESQASTLVRLATTAGVELFHFDEVAFASFRVNGHRETWPIRSHGFRQFLKLLYYRSEEERVPGSQAVQDAIEMLEGKARFCGHTEPVYVRLGERDGAIYLDLANDAWEAVEITASGWRVVPEPPVKLLRRKGLLALPYPVRDGSIDALRPFVNVADDDDFRLLVGFLLGALRPSEPHAGLELNGEQGCAKSTTGRVLRKVIDPNTADLRSPPSEERDLMIAATNGYLVAYDNLSRLPEWLSDALCRLATGAAFSTRTLFSDDEETMFCAIRPFLLTGIGDVISKPDLMDRTIMVRLPVIPDTTRMPEAEFWSAFEKAQPRVLGALLDAVVVGLRNLPHTKLATLPRMADFAKWVTAAETGLGWKPGTFMAAYCRNREEANSLALEASPIGSVVIQFIQDTLEWEGTTKELLGELNSRVAEETSRAKEWPKQPRGLTSALLRAAPNLRAIGVHYTPPTKDGHGNRKLRLQWIPTERRDTAVAYGDTAVADSNRRIDRRIPEGSSRHENGAEPGGYGGYGGYGGSPPSYSNGAMEAQTRLTEEGSGAALPRLPTTHKTGGGKQPPEPPYRRIPCLGEPFSASPTAVSTAVTAVSTAVDSGAVDPFETEWEEGEV